MFYLLAYFLYILFFFFLNDGTLFGLFILIFFWLFPIFVWNLLSGRTILRCCILFSLISIDFIFNLRGIYLNFYLFSVISHIVINKRSQVILLNLSVLLTFNIIVRIWLKKVICFSITRIRFIFCFLSET